MHDIASLDELGLPGAMVASSEFETAAASQARSLGFVPHQVYIPHPIQDRTDEEMRSLAEGAFGEIVAALCGTPSEA